MSRPIDELINETRVFYQSLIQLTENLHGDSAISLGMRAVLEFLLLNGDETVPNMARKRRVTRQRIQALTNQLSELELVKTVPNPATRRSPLITLTAKGKKMIATMRQKETQLVDTVSVSDSKLRAAKKVLEEVRHSMESDHSSKQG